MKKYEVKIMAGDEVRVFTQAAQSPRQAGEIVKSFHFPGKAVKATAKAIQRRSA